MPNDTEKIDQILPQRSPSVLVPGVAFRRMREAAGLTQQEVAKIFSTTQTIVSRNEARETARLRIEPLRELLAKARESIESLDEVETAILDKEPPHEEGTLERLIQTVNAIEKTAITLGMFEGDEVRTNSGLRDFHQIVANGELKRLKGWLLELAEKKVKKSKPKVGGSFLVWGRKGSRVKRS